MLVEKIYIRCSNCGKKERLIDAVLGDWKLCKHCNLPFCLSCATSSEKNDYCLGSKYYQPHQPNFTLLPVQELLEAAKDLKRTPKDGKYISKLFYEAKTRMLEKKEKRVTISEEQLRVIHFRREQWKKFGTVLVKRKDGKFITWGQID